MRCFTFLLFLAVFAAVTPAGAQLAPTNELAGALSCLKVTVQIARQFAKINPGKCRIVCKGCGCNGGPGYRGPPSDRNPVGDCVGFENIISVCGPPPHSDCTRECAAVRPQCLGHGRSLLALKAVDFGLKLDWDEAAAPQTDKTEAPITQNTASPTAPVARSVNESFQFTCGTKRTCKEMDSCEEAKFYYSSCGLARLDGTKTGIPCKALCGR